MIPNLIKGAGRAVRAGGRKTAATAGASAESIKTVSKHTGGAVAKKAAIELLETEYKEEPPSGIETVIFRQLPRPRLTEKAAAEMTLEQAQHFAEHAKRFYRFDFGLFSRGDLFYEEVEEDYLNAALGAHEDSIDHRFLEVTSLFRRTLNDNTRKLHFLWAPALFVLAFGLVFALGLGETIDTMAVFGLGSAPWVAFGAAGLLAFSLLLLVYSWPYKFVQQRNLMNLDNYITSKFSRINNNFQVAKRRALNVERDKRIPQRDQLRDEAGAWTLSYQWFAMRLLLCEMALRNKFYQVRRNTSLYWFVGIAFIGVLWIAGVGAGLLSGVGSNVIAAYASAGLFYIIASAFLLRRATRMMFRVLESNEWARFSQIDLDETIRDHVGEDKLQIVTFRDRNRME